jgi:hypothetical protein
MVESPAAFWCRIPSRPNFGDALTPWLIHRLSGRYPRFRPAADAGHKYLVTGSVIGLAGPPCTVWGAGIMHAREHIAGDTEVLAVRGPLTRERVLAAGVPCPAVYGDPALLLPRVYAPSIEPVYEVGLALHFSDRPRILASRRLPTSIRLIDMQQPVETVIDQLLSCKLVASSSLHGLIVSHAYGRPASWIEFRPLPSGDGSKFRDYLQSICVDQHQPLRLTPELLSPDLLSAHAIDPPVGFDPTPLWNTCPFLVCDEPH